MKSHKKELRNAKWHNRVVLCLLLFWVPFGVLGSSVHAVLGGCGWSDFCCSAVNSQTEYYALIEQGILSKQDVLKSLEQELNFQIQGEETSSEPETPGNPKIQRLADFQGSFPVVGRSDDSCGECSLCLALSQVQTSVSVPSTYLFSGSNQFLLISRQPVNLLAVEYSWSSRGPPAIV